MKLLLIDDDQRLTAALGAGLVRHGYETVRFGDGERALDYLASTPCPDLVLLDLGLPGLDGFLVCERIRRSSTVPIIMLTGRDQVKSRIHGLNLGADDYMVKPFSLAELIARIHAVTRRSRPAKAEARPVVVTVGPVTLDEAARTVLLAGEPVALTRTEFDLLLLLLSHPGVAMRREQIISRVWKTDAGRTRTLEAHICALRIKLRAPDVIETVRGVGYRVAAG